jgi:hypothetical protein
MPKLSRLTFPSHWLLQDPTACLCVYLMVAGCLITALLRGYA